MTTPAQPDEGLSTPHKTDPQRTEALRDVTSTAGDMPPLPSPLGRALPRRLGRYEIVRQLGAGGMAVVYLAHDTELDRQVALKVPHVSARNDAEVLERFYREARAAATLHHPNICPVYDVGKIDGVDYLTMAYIEGSSLAQHVAEIAAGPVDRVVVLVQTLAGALDEAHRQGVIHRDLKPGNVLLNLRGEPIITDFGLARRLDRNDQRLTELGTVMGTPAYMPPEQVRGQSDAIGPLSDLYSLGIILYELLTGRVPFEGTIGNVLSQIVAPEPPPPPSHYRPDIDPRLEAICLRAIARKKEFRFASMREFADALGTFLQEKTTVTLTPEKPAPDPTLAPRLAGDVLAQLRTWGAGMGLRKLRGRMQQAREGRRRDLLQIVFDWMNNEEGAAQKAAEAFSALSTWPSLQGWALAAQATTLLRQRDYRGAHRLLDEARDKVDPTDSALQGTLAHTRAVAHFHEGQTDRALPQLHEALTRFGTDHFATGRVLDSLGMVYASRANFRVAREFFEQSIRHKRRFDDEPGLALSYGQLGRLYLDWGHLDQAEENFQEDLRLAQKLMDDRGEAQMYNHLGQVALARGDREATAGRRAAAKRYWTEAAGWLDGSIRLCLEHGNPVTEGFARKDRALVALAQGQLTEAEQQAQKADDLFRAASFAEGIALTNRVWGMVRRGQGRLDEATRKLRAALSYFESTGDQAQEAQTLWEIARTQREASEQSPLITRAFLEALERAEACRRPGMVKAIEDELQEVDHEAHFRHLYRRVRGHALGEEAGSLGEGASEVVTVMVVEVQGFAEYAQVQDPEAVLQTLNQMLADLEGVLERQRARVVTYFGDGFLALLRDDRHAERAVEAALDLTEGLREFNRPRRILGLPLFEARVGVHTGHAFLGNVGTYGKMDFTAVGSAVTLASRLLSWAEPGCPCLTRTTYEQVVERFTFKSGEPRMATPAGLDPCEVWDVIGRT
jgi:class 3 adenylate cyclase/predicted Ser/Thr protein kinase